MMKAAPHLRFVRGNGRRNELLFLRRKAGTANSPSSAKTASRETSRRGANGRAFPSCFPAFLIDFSDPSAFERFLGHAPVREGGFVLDICGFVGMGRTVMYKNRIQSGGQKAPRVSASASRSACSVECTTQQRSWSRRGLHCAYLEARSGNGIAAGAVTLIAWRQEQSGDSTRSFTVAADYDGSARLPSKESQSGCLTCSFHFRLPVILARRTSGNRKLRRISTESGHFHERPSPRNIIL
jgi:hypothetical protein